MGLVGGTIDPPIFSALTQSMQSMTSKVTTKIMIGTTGHREEKKFFIALRGDTTKNVRFGSYIRAYAIQQDFGIKLGNVQP